MQHILTKDLRFGTLVQNSCITISQAEYVVVAEYVATKESVLQVSSELGNHYSDVLAAQDVALYGGLCALASFDRSEIKRHVVESIGFRETLELNPEVTLPVACVLSLNLSGPHAQASIVSPASCHHSAFFNQQVL